MGRILKFITQKIKILHELAIQLLITTVILSLLQ